MTTKRKKKYTPGVHCVWCYSFDETVEEIKPITKARLEYLKDERLTYECPGCGCAFDDTKGADVEYVEDEDE